MHIDLQLRLYMSYKNQYHYTSTIFKHFKCLVVIDCMYVLHFSKFTSGSYSATLWWWSDLRQHVRGEPIGGTPTD